MDTDPVLSVTQLSYRYQFSDTVSLHDVNLTLPRGSRTIIIGANGAGKSTLLQILAGKRLVSSEGSKSSVLIKGYDPFGDPPPGIAFLGTEWAKNRVVHSDVVVSDFLNSVTDPCHEKRKSLLLDILNIDLNWRMHKISDGERRRVQLCFGLMILWDVLLLDEVTVDLDVVVRNNLLGFLKADSEERGATILYATHIFDGLNDFPTHLVHMRLGSILGPPVPWPLRYQHAATSSLYALALQWINEDRGYIREVEVSGRKAGVVKREQALPVDSHTFYKKYDYNN